MANRKWLFIAIFCCLMLAQTVLAQDTETSDNAPVFSVHPELVTASGTDGLTLFGDFFLVNHGNPTILLLHELYTNRTSWHPYIEPLLASGYNVLAVDLRGYGSTGGGINWNMAVKDVQVWMDWLRAEAGVRGNAISTMGSSMGANLALVGCANDAACRTSIAISPGWRYYGISVKQAFERDFGTRPVMLVYADRDRWPALGVPRIMGAATNEVTLTSFPGNTHGMYLIAQEAGNLMPTIIKWFNAHGR